MQGLQQTPLAGKRMTLSGSDMEGILGYTEQGPIYHPSGCPTAMSDNCLFPPIARNPLSNNGKY